MKSPTPWKNFWKGSMELVILGEWIEKPRTYIVSSLRPSCIFWITEFNVVEWNIKVQPMQNLCQQSSVHGKLVRCQNLTFYDNIGRLLGQLLKSNERKLYIQSLWFYNLFHCKILFGFHIFLCHAYISLCIGTFLYLIFDFFLSSCMCMLIFLVCFYDRWSVI